MKTALVVVAAMLAPEPALAHAGGGDALHGLEVLAALALGGAWCFHTLGARRRPRERSRVLCFNLGAAAAAFALFGPLDRWAAGSTAVHMVQHMLLMLVIAPLLVVARPLAVWRDAVAPRLRPAFDAAARAVLRPVRSPPACALVHAAAVWVWHAPGPYLIALHHGGWHVAEHASFLFTAWLFWWSVLRAGRRRVLDALAALLFTLAHTGMLGGLLTFATRPLYGAESRGLWDQQLAGLLMWVPGGLVYLGAMAWVVLRALDDRSAAPRSTRASPGAAPGAAAP